MLVGLHMIMEQIIDLRDDVRQKQTLSEEISVAKTRLEVKGAPLDKAKQAYLKAKKSLAARKKKRKGIPKHELKELTTEVNDTYRMWQWHMCGHEDVQKAADRLKKHLDESLENCRISVRPGSAVWFGKVRASSALTMDNAAHHHGQYSTDFDEAQTSHRSLSRCMNIGLSDDLTPNAALTTAELDGWRALGVDDEVDEVLAWTPHPLRGGKESKFYLDYDLKSYEAAKVVSVGVRLTIPSTEFGSQSVGVSVFQADSGATGTVAIRLTGKTTAVVISPTNDIAFDTGKVITVGGHDIMPAPTEVNLSFADVPDKDFPADKAFLIGQEGRAQEIWVDPQDPEKGIQIKMTFEHKRMKKVFDSNGMKKELDECDDKDSLVDYYIMFKPEHVSLRASWVPHHLKNKKMSYYSTYEPKPYEAVKVTGGEGFPADKAFLIGQEGRAQEMWVDPQARDIGIQIKMTFEHKQIKKIFESNGMKKELDECGDKDHYIMFKPEHVSSRASKNRSGTIKTDNGDGTFNVKWSRDENGKANVGSVEDEVKRGRIKLSVTGKKNTGDNRMPETTRQWLEYCESTWENVTGVQTGAISNADISIETKGEDTGATGDMPTTLRLNRFRTASLSRRKSALQSSQQPECKQEFVDDDTESKSDKFGDHEWRSPLFWLVRGLRYHRNEMIKTKEQYLDLFSFVQWWLQALSGIDIIADLEDDTAYAMNHINEDFPGKAEKRATDEDGKVVGGSPMYQVMVDTSLAQAWRAIECKSFARLKEIFNNFSLDEESGAPPNAEPLIRHLLQTRIGQGETWLRDRNPKGRFNQWCTSPQDGPNTVIQRRKWYRVGESFMRGNAFHLAVLVGDPEIFAFLLKSLRANIFKPKTARITAEGGGKDDEGETKDGADGSISDEKVDNMMAWCRHNGFSAAATAAAAAAAYKVSGENISSSDTCNIDEGNIYSITSPMYDAEVAQMCLNTLNAHGRSEMRCAIGRYNVLQTAAAFNKHKKAAPLLCGLLSHIEDMHSKPSKLVRRRETH